MATQYSKTAADQKIILDLKVNAKDALDAIIAAQDHIKKLKEEKAALEKEMKTGNGTKEMKERLVLLKTEIKDLNAVIKANEKELTNNVNQYKQNGDSINAMRAQLKNLRSDYEDLSAAERESEFGKNMLNDIDTLTTKIKQLEFAQQDYNRQVGEYNVVSQPARTALREMKMECQNLAVALSTVEGKIKAQTNVVNTLAATIGTENAEYAKQLAELNRLNSVYDDTKKKLSDLEVETGKMADTLADSSKRIASFANDEQKIVAMQEGVNVLTSAFTALQGGMAALGVESKSLLEIYAKIQIVQQSLNSLLVLYKALNKDSNLMIAARLKLEKTRMIWTDAYNAALAKQNGEIAVNTTQEVANAAATTATSAANTVATGTTFSLTAAFAAFNAVLKANPIIAIASAIILAVTGIVAVVKKLTKANKEEEESAKAAAEAEKARMDAARNRIKEQASAITQVTSKYEEEIAKIKALIAVTKSEITSYKDKKAAIEELNRIIPEFNGAIDATGNLIRGNTAAIDEYISKLLQKAAAEAYYSTLVDAYKQMAQLQTEYNIAIQELGRLQDSVDPSLWRVNEAIIEQTRLVDELWQKIQDYQETVWTIEAGAAAAIDVSQLTTTPKSKSTKTDKNDDYEKQLEDARKFFTEIQKVAREFQTNIEKMQDDALQGLVRAENERYLQELGTLTDAYNQAIDLKLKGDDFLNKAGIDPAALQRYIDSLSAYMDKAREINKENVKKIRDDYYAALAEIERKTGISFQKLTSRLRDELARENASEVDIIRLNLKHKLDALDEEMEAELAAHQYTEQQKTEITELYAQKRAMLAREAAKEEQIAWINGAQDVLGAMSQVTGAFSSLFGTLAENDEKYQKYANALALADIMVNMATGIAAAVAKGIEMGWPAAAIMIPLGIATVVSGIAQAIAVFKKNKVQSAPKFANGGLVGNRTTTKTDDRIDAKLSEGEYVIKSKVVKALGVEFFDKLNGISRKKKPEIPLKFASGGVVPSMTTVSKIDAQIDYSEIGEVFKEAVSEVHPVVSVQEINSMQTRVTVKEQTASYK